MTDKKRIKILEQMIPIYVRCFKKTFDKRFDVRTLNETRMLFGLCSFYYNHRIGNIMDDVVEDLFEMPTSNYYYPTPLGVRPKKREELLNTRLFLQQIWLEILKTNA